MLGWRYTIVSKHNLCWCKIIIYSESTFCMSSSLWVYFQCFIKTSLRKLRPSTQTLTLTRACKQTQDSSYHEDASPSVAAEHVSRQLRFRRDLLLNYITKHNSTENLIQINQVPAVYIPIIANSTSSGRSNIIKCHSRVCSSGVRLCLLSSPWALYLAKLNLSQTCLLCINLLKAWMKSPEGVWQPVH